MTTTTNTQAAVGSLCWVQPETHDLPTQFRGQTALLAIKASEATRPWLYLLPKQGSTSGMASEVGWDLAGEIAAFPEYRDWGRTHRGWWGAGTYLYQASDGPALCEQCHISLANCEHGNPFAPDDEVATLRAQLVQARADTIIAVKALEDFKIHASDVLGEAASEHDLCGVYDQVAERAGLYRRVSPQDVEVTVSYTQTVSIAARTWEQAVEMIQAKTAARYFSPPTPFTNDDDITDYGSAYSLSISVND